MKKNMFLMTIIVLLLIILLVGCIQITGNILAIHDHEGKCTSVNKYDTNEQIGQSFRPVRDDIVDKIRLKMFKFVSGDRDCIINVRIAEVYKTDISSSLDYYKIKREMGSIGFDSEQLPVVSFEQMNMPMSSYGSWIELDFDDFQVYADKEYMIYIELDEDIYPSRVGWLSWVGYLSGHPVYHGSNNIGYHWVHTSDESELDYLFQVLSLEE